MVASQVWNTVGPVVLKQLLSYALGSRETFRFSGASSWRLGSHMV